MKLALCHPSGAKNFELASSFERFARARVCVLNEFFVGVNGDQRELKRNSPGSCSVEQVSFISV